MKKEYQEIEIENKDATQFIPFRNRKSYWGDRSMRPLIPNVATVIPPDVNPELLSILLYRMKLEENAYKMKNLDSQAINVIWQENKIDTYLFPNQEDAILSKAYECGRFEKYSLIKEIDQALPPVLPPPIIFSASAELPSVRPFKTPFSFSVSKDQDSLQDQSINSEYSEDNNLQQKDLPEDENSQEEENSNESSQFSSQFISNQEVNKQIVDIEKQNNEINHYENSPNNLYPPYKSSFNNFNTANDRQYPPPSPYEDELRRQPLNYAENSYGGSQLPQSSLPFHDSNKASTPYSNPSYRYSPTNYDNFSSHPNIQLPKQQQFPPPPPPPFMQNHYDRTPMSQYPRPPPPPPPPPPQPMNFTPLPPPPPLLGKDRSTNLGNGTEGIKGSQNSNQWNRYGNDDKY